jgi:hypothetical protein
MELAAESMSVYLQHLKSGSRVEAETAVLAPSDANRRETLRKSLERTIAQWKSGALWMDSVETHIAGDWALAVMLVTMRRNERTDLAVRDEYLFRQNGQWKIALEVVRADAAIRPLMNDDFRALHEWFRKSRVRLEEEYVKASEARSPE